MTAGDVNVTASMTDVREQGTLDDYTGELSVEQQVQLTDHGGGPSQTEPVTVQSNPFRFGGPVCGDGQRDGRGHLLADSRASTRSCPAR